MTQHASTEMHKKAILAKGASNIGAFFGAATVETDKIAASEASYVYHTVKHGLSYNSANCLVKLNRALFHDSNVVKKMILGRAKAEMITMNVLGPKTVQDILNDPSLTEGEPVFYSVASNASNKGNRKMFPVYARYFSV